MMRCTRDPTVRPSAWPAKPKAASKAMATIRYVRDAPPECRWRTTVGTTAAATVSPRASPTHDSTRATKPRRWPTTAAAMMLTTISPSRRLPST